MENEEKLFDTFGEYLDKCGDVEFDFFCDDLYCDHTVVWNSYNDKLTEKAKMEEFMFVGLRKCIGVSKTEFKNRFNYSIDEIYGDVIDKFIKNNLLSENDNSDRIYLTDKGIDLSNYILSEFLL